MRMTMGRAVYALVWMAAWVYPGDTFIHPRRRQNVFDASSPGSRPQNSGLRKKKSSLHHIARYGPNDTNLPPNTIPDFPSSDGGETSDGSEQEEWEREDEVRVARQQVEFQDLVQNVLKNTEPTHLPSLLTKHMELLLTMRGYEGAELIKNVLRDARVQGGEDQERATMDAVECILSFAEEFVDQAQNVDGANKALLGKIIRTMANRKEGATARDQEELLDDLMETEKSNFTPGFLKHIEGECDRIASAPVVTPESARLLEVMRLIQARVLEELGEEIGEGAVVLGQLLGFDDANERHAVLDAGLMVRGINFAHEMVALTKEALDGFQRVPGGADPELVERVAGIQARIQNFIQRESPKP